MECRVSFSHCVIRGGDKTKVCLKLLNSLDIWPDFRGTPYEFVGVIFLKDH